MLEIKPSALVAVLVDDMRDALEAIEAGDYDAAHAILAARCKPGELLQDTVPTLTLSLSHARTFRDVVETCPVPLTPMNRSPAEHLAYEADRAFTIEASGQTVTPERVARLSESCAAFGFVVYWRSDDEPDAEGDG